MKRKLTSRLLLVCSAIAFHETALASFVSPPSNRLDPRPSSPLFDLAPPVEVDVKENGLGAWIPIASAKALSGLDPVRRTVMGIDLVIWSSSGPSDPSALKPSLASKLKLYKKKPPPPSVRWSVQADICPHRLAPLSQGRVDPLTGRIECPYHGWQFETNGDLALVPQLEEGASMPKSGNASSLSVSVVGDMIFAWLPSEVHGECWEFGVTPDEMYDGLSEEAESGVAYFTRDLPYSFDFLVENFMDPAHIPFAHNGLQGKRTDGSPIKMKLVANNFTHVEVEYQDKIMNATREGVVSFHRPSYYHFRTKRDDGVYKKNLQVYAVPIKAGYTRVMFNGPAPGFLPTWISHGGSNRFLNTDTWLHNAERVARKDGTDTLDYVLASRSDMGPTLFRNWWNTVGLDKAPPHTFGPGSIDQLGPELTRREQIDPWKHHSEQCSDCRTALGKLKKTQTWSAVVGVCGILFVKKSPVFTVALAGAAIFTHQFCKKSCTFIEGNPFESGVQPRSSAHMS